MRSNWDRPLYSQKKIIRDNAQSEMYSHDSKNSYYGIHQLVIGDQKSLRCNMKKLRFKLMKR